MTKPGCLLLLLVVGVHHVHYTEANIISDVLSWVGLGDGGSEVKEDPNTDNDVESVEEEAPADDVVEGNESVVEEEGADGDDTEMETEEETVIGRTEEL